MPGNKRNKGNKVASIGNVIERLGKTRRVIKKGTDAATSIQAGRAKPTKRATVDGTRGRRRCRTTVSRVASPIPSIDSEEELEEEAEEKREEELVVEEDEREESEEREEGPVVEELEEGEYEVETSAEKMEWPVPKESKIWLRGVSTLPSRPYPHNGLIVKPAGLRALVVDGEYIKVPRQPSSIIGCLCRHYYPGLVPIGDGEEEPAWSWEHWKRAPDTKDKWARVYGSAAERVVNDFWDFFTCAEGMKDEANEVVEVIAKKIVQDMPYEARVDAMVKYFAHERKMLLKKSLARRVHLTRSMYMKAVPSWCNNNLPCYQQIISKWIDPEWRAQHRMASERRALMGGPVHLQGNLNLHAYVQKKNRERGEGQEKLNIFTGLCLSRKSKKPEGGWVNPGAGLRIDAYSGKFKEHNGPDSDPAS
ncbi:uncharacterized protein LOC119339375 [Triticum dicoccoides]|uniref:uncharacterized protein LOC119339375 n=1 Tax=Triticum dicoccoides TaxID=85692 RepID=UPI0018912FE3|nr:uncharacterized protein LOC119339375 [Triticum dicoccoides]